MKILIIPSWYKTNDNPLLGTFFEEQARMFQNKNINTSILYPNHIPSFKYFVNNINFCINKYNDKGIQTYIMRTFPILPGILGEILSFPVIKQYADRAFKEYVKECGMPDLIHAHSIFYGGVISEFLSKKYNIPFVLTEHLSTLVISDEFNRFPFVNMIKQVFENAKKVIFVSSEFKNIFLKKYHYLNIDASVINNVVNPIFFNVNSIREINKNCIKIINIGRLTRLKNQILILRAAKILKSKNINFLINIIGDGDQYDILKKYVEKNNLINVINFINRADRQTIVKYIKDSDILISSSLFETFGLTVAEACALGKPVVAYDAKGVTDIINKNNGIIVNKNSPDIFANAIIKVINNYSSYDKKLIKEECRKRFSEEVVFNKLINLYNKII